MTMFLAFLGCEL